MTKQSLFISSNFDGGNIEVVDCQQAHDIQLNIRRDNQSEFYQWFYFRLTGAQGQDCRLRLMNAGQSAYPDGWEGYQAVASYDREFWFRVPTQYQDGELLIEHTPSQNSVYYAYFAPYTMERHHDLIAALLDSPRVAYERLGATLDGQDMDLLTISEHSDSAQKKALWVIARQHPGESMAEWFMEGFIDRLLDEDDPVSRVLLEKAVVYVVPNMNPDGSRRGHLRTNACGANLNREWIGASIERSPEVYFVREKMKQTGVDFCLDVHGDEALPYNFIAGGEGIAHWNDRHQQLLDGYKNTLARISPDFQTAFGYPVDAPGSADLQKCTDYIAETFGCLSMTLEMPFKDTIDSPNEVEGWSPERCRQLGRANVDAIFAMIEQI